MRLPRHHRADRDLQWSAARQLLFIVILLSGAVSLSGCVPLIIGGVAVGATVTMHDRREPDAILDDQRIELEAMGALIQNAAVRDRSQISVTSYNRTALLTGNADTSEIAEQANTLVSRVAKVKQVIDEVKVGPRLDLTRQTEDTYLTARVKTDLLGVKLPGFDPTRVKVVTSDAVVYLMGIVSPDEADAAATKASYVPGVQRVVKLFEYTETSDVSPSSEG